MHLGRVIGRVVATQRLPGLIGVPLQIVVPLDERGEPAGPALVACDVIGSGPGDIVHVCDGREATMALTEPFVPVDATIVGHVEQFRHDGPGPQVEAQQSFGGAPRTERDGDGNGAAATPRRPRPRGAPRRPRGDAP